MHDSRPMSVGNRSRDRANRRQSVFDGKGAGCQLRGKRAASDPLHHQVAAHGRVVAVSNVADDGWVSQQGEGSRLAFEARFVHFLVEKHLDRNRRSADVVAGLVHDAHSAVGDALSDLEAFREKRSAPGPFLFGLHQGLADPGRGALDTFSQGVG